MKFLFILLLGLGFSQTELTTRVYEYNLYMSQNSVHYLDIEELTGFSLEYAHLKIFLINNLDSNDNSELILEFSDEGDFEYPDGEDAPAQQETFMGDAVSLHTDGFVDYYPRTEFYNLDGANNKVIYKGNNQVRFRLIGGTLNNADVLISVTAPFPQEDTGYIEDGFEFCLTPGANLLSFPCDNSISVGESLPQGVENFITEIVGQGVAASYSPTLGWIGNLAEFTPGSGYWFKSNESLCFEYDCVED